MHRLGDMSPDEFRTAGYQAVDWIAEFLERIEERPVASPVVPGSIKETLPPEAPETGEDISRIFSDINEVIMPGMTHWNHPNFFAYFTSSGSGAGILGDLFSAAFNVNSMLWKACPAATELEEVTLGWFRGMLGLPADFKGISYEGGSTANLHGIAAAREFACGESCREHGLVEQRSGFRVYTSEMSHSSVDRAVILLGLGLRSIRRIAVDERFRMRAGALARAIEEDRNAGLKPLCVVATVGSTSCTSIDPLVAIGQICEREGIWLHVDACYAGSAAIVPEFRHILDGCERADSIVVNPHKWLFVPLDLSAFYTRRPGILKRAFSLVPEYLKTGHGDEVENFMDYGISLGRRFRALKFWFVLRYFGRQGLIERIREHIRIAQALARDIDEHPEFELMAPTPLSTICFRAHPKGLNNVITLNELNEKMINSINDSGMAFLSHTKLNQAFVLRLVVSHLRTEERHVRAVWELLQKTLQQLGYG